MTREDSTLTTKTDRTTAVTFIIASVTSALAATAFAVSMLRVGAVAWVFFALQVLGGPAIAVVRPKVIHTTSPKPFRWYGVGLAISAGLVLMLSLAIAVFRGEINRVVNGSALLNLAFACLVPGTHFLLWYKAAETILSLRIRRQS